jgi:hypothetical protein
MPFTGPRQTTSKLLIFSLIHSLNKQKLLGLSSMPGMNWGVPDSQLQNPCPAACVIFPEGRGIHYFIQAQHTVSRTFQGLSKYLWKGWRKKCGG